MVKYSRQVLIILFLTFLVYLPVIPGKFLWDDEQFIYKNQAIINFDLPAIFTQSTTAGAGLASNYYRPLTSLSFAIDHLIWQNASWGYHLTSIFCHLLAISLLAIYLKLLKITGKIWLVAALALHPLQTEAVAYINSRGDSLFVIFGLASLISLILVSQKKLTTRIGPIRVEITPWAGYLLTTGLFGACFLAKELGLIFWGLQLLTLLTIRRQPTKFWNLTTADYWLLASTLCLGLIYTGLRATWLNFADTFNFLAGVNDPYARSLVVRLLTFSLVILNYFRLLIIPWPLHMERTVPIVTDFGHWAPWLAIAIISGWLWLGWREYKTKQQIWIWFGLSWFLIGLSLTSGVIAINGIIYEHWLYLPLVGFFLALSSWLTQWQWPPSTHRYLKKGWGLVVGSWMILTVRQNYLWAEPLRFYEYTLRYSQSARLYNNLGMTQAEASQLEAALQSYQQGLKINPLQPELHYNLGNTYLQLNQPETAVAAYRQAMTLNPKFSPAANNLISYYLTTNQLDLALTTAREWQAAWPNDDQIPKLITKIEKQLAATSAARPSTQPLPKLPTDQVWQPAGQN